MTESHAIDRTTRISPIAALERHERIDRGPVDQPDVAPAEAATFDGIPATVPDEVLAEIGAAMDRLDDLRADGTTVRFHAGDGAGARIELSGPDGSRRIGATELFGIVDGSPATTSTSATGETPAGATPRIDREA